MARHRACADMAASDDRSTGWTTGAHAATAASSRSITDAFLYGRTLIGQTVEDLLRWENWLAPDARVKRRRRGHLLRRRPGDHLSGVSAPAPAASTPAAPWARSPQSSPAATTRRPTAFPACCSGWTAATSPGSAPRGRSGCTTASWTSPGPDERLRRVQRDGRAGARTQCDLPKALDAADRRYVVQVTPKHAHEMDNDDLLAFLS